MTQRIAEAGDVWMEWNESDLQYSIHDDETYGAAYEIWGGWEVWYGEIIEFVATESDAVQLLWHLATKE